MLSDVSRRTGLPQRWQNRRGGPREQQLQVIVQLRHRADGGARRAHRIRLVDRDGRRNAGDAVDLRLVHAIEELPRVRRERLDVTPLAFGIQRVEHERGFARARDARHDDELVERQIEIEILEIVLARAANERWRRGSRRSFRARQEITVRNAAFSLSNASSVCRARRHTVQVSTGLLYRGDVSGLVGTATLGGPNRAFPGGPQGLQSLSRSLVL